jgi:hypothetical protein
MRVRQVVTGHDAVGRAVFVRDEQVDAMPIPGLGELAFLWSADEPATYPNAGNIVVEVDDGAELLLSPGDVVVQNGTRHRWRVAGDVPATMAAFMIGAHHL